MVALFFNLKLCKAFFFHFLKGNYSSCKKKRKSKVLILKHVHIFILAVKKSILSVCWTSLLKYNQICNPLFIFKYLMYNISFNRGSPLPPTKHLETVKLCYLWQTEQMESSLMPSCCYQYLTSTTLVIQLQQYMFMSLWMGCFTNCWSLGIFDTTAYIYSEWCKMSCWWQMSKEIAQTGEESPQHVQQGDGYTLQATRSHGTCKSKRLLHKQRLRNVFWVQKDETSRAWFSGLRSRFSSWLVLNPSSTPSTTWNNNGSN